MSLRRTDFSSQHKQKLYGGHSQVALDMGEESYD